MADSGSDYTDYSGWGASPSPSPPTSFLDPTSLPDFHPYARPTNIPQHLTTSVSLSRGRGRTWSPEPNYTTAHQRRQSRSLSAEPRPSNTYQRAEWPASHGLNRSHSTNSVPTYQRDRRRSTISSSSTTTTEEDAPNQPPPPPPSSPSQHGLEFFSLDAFRAWDRTRGDLGAWWKDGCFAGYPMPQLHGLWTPLADFSSVLEMYLGLAGAEGRSLRPRSRARFLAWRTQEQKEMHDRDWGISSTSARENAEENNDDDDDDDDDDNVDVSRLGTGYPLNPWQLREFARICYEMEYEVRELVGALIKHNNAARTRSMLAGAGASEVLVEELTLNLQACCIECERVARMPLQWRLASARDEMCLVLGLDVAKVFGRGNDDSDDEDEYENGDDNEPKPATPMMSGAITHSVSEKRTMSRSHLKMQILALRLGRATFLSNLSINILPSWVTGRLLGWLTTKPTDIMDRMEDEDGNAGTDESAKAKLQELNARIDKLVKKTNSLSASKPSWRQRAAMRTKGRAGYSAVKDMW